MKARVGDELIVRGQAGRQRRWSRQAELPGRQTPQPRCLAGQDLVPCRPPAGRGIVGIAMTADRWDISGVRGGCHGRGD